LANGTALAIPEAGGMMDLARTLLTPEEGFWKGSSVVRHETLDALALVVSPTNRSPREFRSHT
jgi:hypothetical protein